MKAYLKATIITAFIATLLYAAVSLALLGVSVQTALSARADAARLSSQPSLAISLISSKVSRAAARSRWSGWLRLVPVVRKPYIAYRDLLASAETLTGVVQRAFDDGVISFENGQWTVQETLLPVLAFDSLDEIQQALSLFAQSVERASQTPLLVIPPTLREDWTQWVQTSQQIQAFISEWQPYLSDLPTILGAYEPYDILILQQNPHELRPTGGFIGTFGRLTFERGQVKQFYTDDIYNLDVNLLRKQVPEAPWPFRQYLGVNDWYVRDANWSPDFPTAAQQVIRLYELASGEEDIDMVVAITPAVVEAFLDITGPITVDNITFTSKNLVDALEYRVEQEYWQLGLRNEERKKIVNDLAQALQDRFLSMDYGQIREYFGYVKRILEQNDILLYATDEKMQRELFASGWAGEIRSSAHDYLYIVDANLGGLKTDRLVERTYRYDIRQQENGAWLATVSLTYTNNGFFDYRTTRYRTYTRLYAPLGSTFVSAQGFMDKDKGPSNAQPQIYAEDGKFVVGGFISIEPKQSRTVTISYLLPPWLAQSIQDGNQYKLLWQKQPGVMPNIEFRIESKENLRSFAPSQLSYKLENPHRLSVGKTLDTDLELYVVFH